MATNMGSIGKWIEEHPYATGAIVFVGGLGLLWLFGFFGSKSSGSAQQGTNNLAAAYYAAEAAQTTAGTNLQLATVAANAQTAQVQTQANAAVAINAARQDAMTTLGSQTLTAQQTLYNDELQSTQTNAAAALAATQSNNYTQLQTVYSNNNTTQAMAAINTILPQELAYSGGQGASINLPGIGNFQVAQGAATPAVMRAEGYTPAQISAMFGSG